MAHIAITSEQVSMFARSSAVCQPGLYSRLPPTATFAARAFSPSMATSAFFMSPSLRTMPTLSCMTSCSSYWIL